MLSKSLLQNFNFNQYVLSKNLEGVSHEDSLKPPAGGGNPLNWVVGHIVAARNGVHALIGAEPVWTEAEAAPYRRGSETLNAANAVPLADLVALYDDSQAKLVAYLEKASDDELAANTDLGTGGGPDCETVGMNLSALQFHEAYHCGQSGILRRSLGKDGALA